jgi:hypothetical protein
MPVIKRRVLEALAEYLRPLVLPEVANTDVIVSDAGAEEHACWPHVVVRQSGVFEFEAFEEDTLWTTSTSQAVQVGDLTGQVEVVIGATNQVQREELEDRILEAFLGFQGTDGLSRPGVIVVQLDGFKVGGKAALQGVPVAYVLQTETWNEEMVFDRKRFSSLTVAVDLPALVIREGVHDIDTLVLAITDDLVSEEPTPDELIAVDEDGNVTPYP